MSAAEATELVIRGDDSLPDIRDAQEQVKDLIREGQAGLLDEVRRRAEAQALYEKRAGHRDREEHFARLRLLTEAALGVLGFDDGEVLADLNLHQRGCWRALASAFERGKLLDCANASPSLSPSAVAGTIRDRGYTFVPGPAIGLGRGISVRWFEARKIAMESGLDLHSLPADPAYIRKQQTRYSNQSRRMFRQQEAQERQNRVARQKAIAAATREKGPRMDAAYAFLRRTLQSLQDAQEDLSGDERRDMKRVFRLLYEAEEEIGELLRVP